jgi:hypothetical protein
MNQKNNFSSYFVLAIFLAYVVDITFSFWSWGRYRDYSTLIFDLQFAALGVYSLFCQNEFLNTNPYYQVIVTSLISSCRCISCIGIYIPYRYDIYFRFVGIAWNVLALAIHYKFPNLLVYILRYEIGFTIFSISIIYISFLNSLNDAIAAVLALGFVFIPYLNFERIANLTSSLLYINMIENGLIAIRHYIPHRVEIYTDLINFNILIGVFIVASVYYRYKKNNTQGIILGTDQFKNSPNPIKSYIEL